MACTQHQQQYSALATRVRPQTGFIHLCNKRILRGGAAIQRAIHVHLPPSRRHHVLPYNPMDLQPQHSHIGALTRTCCMPPPPLSPRVPSCPWRT